MSHRTLPLRSPYPVVFEAVVDEDFREGFGSSVKLDFDGLR